MLPRRLCLLAALMAPASYAVMTDPVVADAPKPHVLFILVGMCSYSASPHPPFVDLFPVRLTLLDACLLCGVDMGFMAIWMQFAASSLATAACTSLSGCS